jgi:hypothetical protein
LFVRARVGKCWRSGNGEDGQTEEDTVRQAVLVIHGIGEQTPGETVRNLVQAAADPDERSAVRSKPDRISHTSSCEAGPWIET